MNKQWFTYDEESGECSEEMYRTEEEAIEEGKKLIREWVVEEGAEDSYLYVCKVHKVITGEVSEIKYNVEEA